MRINLTFIVLITAFLQISVAGYGQRISLSEENASLVKVLRKIQSQSGYKILYGDEVVSNARPVSVRFRNATIKEVLDKCFEGQALSYTIKEKTIIVQPRVKAAGTLRSELPPPVIVKGTVTDAKGLPLPGVSVKVKGTNQSVSTASDGNFTLSAPADNAILVFTYIGFITKEVPLSQGLTLNVTLEEELKALSEVVVVGYGTQRKSSLTAAVSTVKMEDIRNTPRPDVLQSLAGRVPGLTVHETNGEPGSAPEVLVRGVATIPGDNTSPAGPLVLIDGSPSTGLSNLAPGDIESISVLKDAAAAAIYGARAANGVLLVTTKKGGQMDKAVIEFNTYTGIQSPTRFPGTVSSYEYATMINEALTNEGKAPVYSENDLRSFQAGTDPVMHPNTNWLEAVTQKHVPIVNNYLSASGNSKIGRYFLSGEYMYQKGSVKHIDHYNRVNLRANVTSKLSEKLQLQVLTSYQHTKRDAAGTMAIFSNVLRNSPAAAIRYPNGYYAGTMFANGNYLWRVGNQVQVIENYGPVDNRASNYSVNGSLEYKPIKDLTLKLMGVYQAGTGDSSSYQQQFETYDFFERTVELGRNGLKQRWGKSNKYDIQATATYEKKFGNHYLNLLGGYSQESFKQSWIRGERQDFINDELFELNAGDAATQINWGSSAHWAFMSGFGRLSYNFKERYLFEFTGRYDGSSRLSKGNRWDFFPSVSAGWNIQKESFMQNVKWLDLLKLRFSVGQLGNAEKLGLYEPYPRLSVGPHYTFDDTQVVGVRYGNPANPDLTWETTTTYNLGLDGSIRNGLLGFEADIWEKHTDDILLTVPVSTIIGLPTAQMTTNAGKVASHGFDLVLSHNNRINEDLRYNASFTISGWRSWVVDLKDKATPFGEYRPNGDLGDYHGYQATGIINSPEQLINYRNLEGVPPQIGLGDLMYKDQNGDGKIDYMDQVKIGNRYVKTQYGINLGMQYKAFDLAVFVQGAFNTERIMTDYVKNYIMNYNSPLEIHLDRWTPANQNAGAAYPRSLMNYGHNRENSSWWIKSGEYVRLKNVQLGYNLPAKAVSSLKIQSLRAYVAASNLFTYAPNYVDGFDPERDMIDWWYPNFRVVSLGLNLRF
ncbi:TonB-dependent receptor [Desertivirga xinjiangensis]|uniref:TonB-dependent receptor n=1 Tax=Desertivirga xinjiangensis TaxID=539206 RepID=UPI00210895FA|nr:TonB-dependent receptor [Pedobacter xinjiangensis]